MAGNADNPLLATTWWSFGRDRRLLVQAAELLQEAGLRVHDAWSDPDWNRSLLAFSGPGESVAHGLFEIAEAILPSVDLRRHASVHPRTGALDLVRLSPLASEGNATSAMESFGEAFAARHHVPIFLDGSDSSVASEAAILRLREGGFGGLEGLALAPTFGPPLAHEQWGIVCAFVGPLQLLAVVELQDDTGRVAATVAERLHELRSAGDPILLGVEAAGFARASRGGSLLYLEFGLADEVYPDSVLRLAEKEARMAGGAAGRARALGLYRASDVARATRLTLDEDAQVWDDIRI
jgi:hypothetical protein